MKQHITKKQFNELSSSSKKKIKAYFDEGNSGLSSLCDSSDYSLLLSIGQMIEFLNDRELRIFTSKFMEKVEEGETELCDALWTEVKTILEANDK